MIYIACYCRYFFVVYGKYSKCVFFSQILIYVHTNSLLKFLLNSVKNTTLLVYYEYSVKIRYKYNYFRIILHHVLYNNIITSLTNFYIE